MERKKYAKFPVQPDGDKDYECYQGWGYVVVGYFLLEEALKLLLHAKSVVVGKTHTLCDELFRQLPDTERNQLSGYYEDLRNVLKFEGQMVFPFATLEEFLSELDGVQHNGKHVGSLDWRYFLIEHPKGNLPTVSIEFLHEAVYGSLQIAAYCLDGGETPVNMTYSWRKHWIRTKKYQDWLDDRMKSGRWKEESDRLEIVWGPDYCNRCDFFVFKGTSICSRFDEVPEDIADVFGIDLPVIDKRQEIESFDSKAGFASIDAQSPTPARSLLDF